MSAKNGKSLNTSEAGGGETNATTRDASPLVSLFLCLWFLLVAVAFWGPYLGTAVSVAFYGAALLIIVAVGTLGYLRRSEEARRHVD